MRRSVLSHLLVLASLIFLSCFFLSSRTVNAVTLEDLSSVVAFLETDRVQKTVIEGIEYEVYLKPVHGGETIPKTITLKGTGFFVMYKKRLFLVTAEHVASKTTAETAVTLRTGEDRPITFDIMQIYGKDAELNWIKHDMADVAVLALSPKAGVKAHLSKHFLPAEVIQKELGAPERDKSVTILGFPLGLGVSERFSPITKESKPASGLITLRRSDTGKKAPFFLLDSPSIGGFSGAPVFQMPGTYLKGNALVVSKKIICVGIVHGTISDQTGGKMAAIQPAALIIETLQKAAISTAQ